jgi:predicted nuclease of predicted toxin-antitoxin system
MKLLLDMNLTPRWVQFLKAADFTAQHWSEIGRPDAPDKDIMDHAAKNDFIVLTHDLDFSAILAATKGRKPSVIQLRAKDITPEAVGHVVVAALRQSEEELEAGALATVDAHRARVRILPLPFARGT